jgi:hypothetical protein
MYKEVELVVRPAQQSSHMTFPMAVTTGEIMLAESTLLFLLSL